MANGLPVHVTAEGRLGTFSSSRRYKDDIADMDAASSALMKLRPVTFRYKADATAALQYGLIAEEVAEVYPGLVARSDDGRIESVMYQYLPAMLLNEYQKQQREIEAQQRTIQAQSRRIAGLTRAVAEIATLREEVGRLAVLLAQPRRADVVDARFAPRRPRHRGANRPA